MVNVAPVCTPNVDSAGIRMSGILKVIKERRSDRAPFDPRRPVRREDLEKVIEAARWVPTPHNMQNLKS